MKKITAFVSLDTPIDGVMTDLRETTTNNYPYYLNWGLDCFRELTLFVQPRIVTKYFTIGDTFTIPIPDDCIDYLAVGVPINGQLWTLSLNEKLLPKKVDECNVPIEQVIANPAIGTLYPYLYYFSAAFRNGQYVGEQYSVGGGWNSRGYFTVDKENKVFQFQSVVPKSEIVIQYQSTGINCDGTVEIPYESISAHKAFIHWQRVEFDEQLKRQNPRGQIADANRKYGFWKSEYGKLRHYSLMFTVSEYLDMRYSKAKQTPKR